MSVIRYNKKLKRISDEELFKLMKAGGHGDIMREDEFLSFFDSADCYVQEIDDEAPDEASDEKSANVEPVSLTREQLSKTFEALKEEEVDGITKDGFLRLLKTFMKVVKDSTLSTAFEVKETQTKRRLERNEILEVLEGPRLETTVKIRRIRAKALKDGAEGWTTLSSTQGTAFLQECSNLYQVVKETSLTSKFDIGSVEPKADAEGGRRLRSGEILEVLEWPTKHDGSGSMRLKGKVQTDGSIGYATVQDDAGSSRLAAVLLTK